MTRVSHFCLLPFAFLFLEAFWLSFHRLSTFFSRDLSTHRHKYGNVFEPAHSVIPAILRRESIRHALDARLKIAGMTGCNGSFI